MMNCQLCKHEIYDIAFKHDGKPFHERCMMYYIYPTKEDYLNSMNVYLNGKKIE